MVDRPRDPYSPLAARLGLWKPARLVARARAALEEGDLTAARELLVQANRRAPAWAEPLYLLGVCARGANGTRDEEEQLLFAALERDPEHREAEKALLEIRAWRLEPVTRAWRLFHGGRAADALAAFRETFAELGARIPLEERASIVAGIGWCHHGMGRADWGVEAFLEALAYDPGLAHAQKGLGICLYWLGRFAEAEAALLAAIALEPKLLDALAFIGWCAYAQGEYKRALETFEAARDDHPLLGDARWGIAWSRWKLDRVEEAAAAFREAIALDPGHPSAGDVAVWVLPDRRYAQLASAAEAEREPMSELHEKREPRPLVDALSALAEGRAAEALRILAEPGELPPGERWRARLVEGRARLALEEPERALQAFREASELAPGRAEPALEAARVLLRMDSRREAAKILRCAARRTAHHPDIARELERLEGRGT